MEVRTCHKCGAIHPAADRFCPSCGWDSTVEYVKRVGPSQVDYKRAFRAVAVFLGIVIVVVACILINQGGNSPAPVTAVASPTPTPTVTPIFTLPPVATPKADTAPRPSEPKSAPVAVAIDWEKCISDTKTELMNKEYFSYVKDIDFSVNADEKMITMTAALGDSTSPSVALEFADTMIRRFGANAQMQKSSSKAAGKDYYGGIYDEYSIKIGVAPFSKVSASTKEWFVYGVVTRGMHTKQAPTLQKKYR